MFVLIAGGGNVGGTLASTLLREGQKVAIVERNPRVASRLAAELGVPVAEGDAADPGVLQRAGIAGADVVAAVTGEDEDNLVVCTLAKFEFSVPRVVARVNNPRNQWMFDRSMGVDVAINQADIIAGIVREETALSDIVTLLRLRAGQVALVEKIVARGSPLDGRSIDQVALPADVRAVAALRGGRVLIPSAALAFAPGDEVLFLTTVEQEEALARALA